MERITPLVDEVLLAMEREHPLFFREEVYNELHAIFDEKHYPFYPSMGYQAWMHLIMRRLNTLKFDLVKRNDGQMAWGRGVQSAHGTA